MEPLSCVPGDQPDGVFDLKARPRLPCRHPAARVIKKMLVKHLNVCVLVIMGENSESPLVLRCLAF